MKLNFLLLFIITIFSFCGHQKEVVTRKYRSGHPMAIESILSINGGDTLKKITFYWENGKVGQIAFTINGVLDSVSTYWHTDSYQVSERINFSHGKKNGLSSGWYIDGKKRYEVNYVMGLKNGTETDWYENGSKQSEGSYEEGKNVELWTYWYENGNKKEEGSYLGGEFKTLDAEKNTDIPFGIRVSDPVFIPLKHGKWTYYNEKGELIKTEYWEKGNLKDK